MKTDISSAEVMITSFTGKTSHAAAAPDLGRSGFDGLQLAISGIEMLRKHLSEGTEIDYTITSSGNMPCNIVSDYAEGLIRVHSENKESLEWAKLRIEGIIVGAALATGTKSGIKMQN